MKVSELIRMLQTVNPDLPVCSWADGYLTECVRIVVEEIGYAERARLYGLDPSFTYIVHLE